MGYNVYQGQIIGPFSAETNLLTKIRENCADSSATVWHLGIQSDMGNVFKINDKNVQIGKTGIYEIGNTKITQFSCNQALRTNTIIDYVIIK